MVSTETGQAQVDYLAERNVVVAVDLGGHGESGLGRADWNLAAFGDDVLAVVEEVGAQKVALVGHWMGGDAIVHAARQLGDRVAGLVWIDAFRSLGNDRSRHRNRSKPSSRRSALTLRPQSQR